MSELILYISEDGRTRLDLRMDGQTVWLTQLEIAELFQTTKQNVSLHAKNIFGDAELAPDSVVKDSLTAAADGKHYKTQLYNLDLILLATTCHKPSLPFTFTSSFPPKTASPSSAILSSDPKLTPISAAFPNNSIALQSLSVESGTMFTSSPGRPARSLRPTGSRNSNVSPAFGSRSAIHRFVISRGNPDTAFSPLAPPISQSSSVTSPIRKNIIAKPPFRTNTAPSSNATASRGMKNTCGINVSSSHRNAVSFDTATRFCPIAQGWRIAPTLGQPPHAITNPDGVASHVRAVTTRTQPRWGKIFFRAHTQGSRCPATLGFDMESRWDIEKGAADA